MSRAEPEKSTVQMIPLDKIVPSPVQMRSSMDPEALERLAESLRQDGQQRPVKVRRLPDEYFELVFGHRTVDAAKIAGMQVVQAIVEDLTDEEIMWAQYAENEYREDISDYDRAKWLRNMIDRFGYTQESVGERAGLSRQRVSQILRMLQLESKLTAVNLQNMNERQARAILQAPEEDRPALVQYVEVYFEEMGEAPPASNLVDYAREVTNAREFQKNRRRLLEGEPAPVADPEPVEEDIAAFIEEHGLSWVFDADSNGAGFLTKIATLTNEELEFCIANEARALNLQRLNEEMDRREPNQPAKRALLKEHPTTSAQVVATINRIVGEPAEDLHAKLVEEHGLSEEEAQAALEAYQAAYPDIWSRCYPEKTEEDEEPMIVEQYVADVLMYNPDVKPAELARATAEMFGVSEEEAQSLIERIGKRLGRKPRDPTRPTILCPLCGRKNAEKNKILMAREAAPPGIALDAWLKEVFT